MYRKDARELPPVLGWLLTALRTAAFIVVLVLYLQPQWRTEQERQVNSRAAILVDTSLSMGLSDGPSADSTRAGQVIDAFGEVKLDREPPPTARRERPSVLRDVGAHCPR